jgi:rhodopsin family 7TM receptor
MSLLSDEDTNPLLNMILFIIIICISIPSVFINLFAIYRLYANTKLSVFAFRTILHVSLFTTCTCVPFFLLELYFNSHFPLSPLICKLWLIVDYSSIVCLGLLVCWASIQRHILIFGPIHIKKLQSTLKFKLIPTILALGLPLTWYSILASTCTFNKVLNQSLQCRPCFENEKFVFLIDTILSLILPLFVTIIVNFLLVIRIIRLRLRIFRLPSKRWSRCKRLTRQMILFSFIYLIGLLPYVLTNFNSLYDFWPLINLSWCIQIANAFSYVPCCFSSFLSIYAFPEIWKNRRTRHHHHHHHQNSLRINRKSKNTSFPLSSILLTTTSSEM